MIKKIGALIAFGGFSALYTLAAHAQGYGLNEAAEKASYTKTDIYSIISIGIRGFLALLGFVFFGYLFYAGIRWMNARGNEEFVAKAKGSVQSAVFGLIIIFVAYALTTFIFGRINAP